MTLELLFPSLAVLAGFVALVWGADRFVVGSAATARNLGVSPLIIGLTIVGFGTSAPEMLVSATAAWTGSPNLSIGNALGSNITNVGLVLGVAALVNPLIVHSKIIRRELPLLLLTMALAYALMFFDESLDRIDGIVLLSGMAMLIGWVVKEGLEDRKGNGDALVAEFEEELPDTMPTPRAIAWFLVGLVVLLLSSRLLVWGAEETARFFGVGELVIGLSVVAIGTSLPELAASVMAAIKNEHDIAVGNVVGSNMFNLLGVLGLPGIIRPGTFEPACLTRDFPVMFSLTFLLLLFARGFGERGRLARWHGLILVIGFLVYVAFLYLG